MRHPNFRILSHPISQLGTCTPPRCRGQGMTEYIIIVALVAVAAIGVYRAFGDVVRGQAAVAAVALSGDDNSTGRSLVTGGSQRANQQSRSKTLEDFEEQ